MQLNNRSHHGLLSILILAIMVIGAVVVAMDWNDMRRVLAAADWRYLLPIILLTLLSYTFYSYAYAYVAQMLGISMEKRELAAACFISTIVNHVLTTGGVVGYSLRYLLMKLYNVSLKDVLSSSLLHYYLTSLDMLTFMPLSFAYLMLTTAVPPGVIIPLGLMTVLFGLLLILITGLVIFPTYRRPVINMLIRLIRRTIRRDLTDWLVQLDESLTRGTKAIRQEPLRLLWIMLLTLLDFACSIAAIGFVFKSLGPGVPLGTLVSGYVIGIMAGLLSMIPGGLGIQEGSMAGIYALMGVRLEQAILAAILFRVIYYFFPYMLILPFYRRLLRQVNMQISPSG